MTTIIVKGRLVSPTRVELLEPVTDALGDVEVVVRQDSDRDEPQALDRNARELVEFLKSLPPGTRPKEDIDRQIEEERSSWDHRR
jgi:hypothetical protein